MLEKILRINDYRVFQNWRDDAATPNLARVNVIYGINGSGKSSLSRMLAEAPTDTTWRSGLRVRVSDERGNTSIVETPSDPFWENVYVFDRDYVAENLQFDHEGESTTKPLLVLGKKRIDQRQRLSDIDERLRQIADDVSNLSKEKVLRDGRAAKLATDTVTLIAQELAAAGSRYHPRSYDARKVKGLLARSTPLEPSADVPVDPAVINGAEVEVLQAPDRDAFDTAPLEDSVEQLLARRVTVQPIEALRDDSDRAAWVQHGLALHHAGDRCAFCGNIVDEARVAELERHFDQSLVELQEARDAMTRRLDDAQRSLDQFFDSLPAEPQLDPSLRDDRSGALADVSDQRTALSARLDALKVLVESKATHLFTAVEFPAERPGRQTLDASSLTSLLKRHNTLAGDASQRRAAAAQRVEHARVEGMRNDYDTAVARAAACGVEISQLQTEQRTLLQDHRSLSQEDLDATPLAGRLNDDLTRLLGRTDLSFELSDEGYSIRRGTEPALYLSGGEKTAISLLYFLKRLEAHDCDRPNAIVIVDDPVSSLDSNVVAGVSAHLWARLVGGDKCRQLILLTHSFELFRSWTNQLDRLPEQTKQSEDVTCTMQELRVRMRLEGSDVLKRDPFFMIWPTEKRLRNRLRSEYHYLFWRAADTLVKCQNEPSPESELDAAAILPNVCRRLLEGFLSFKYPGKIGDFRGLVEAAIGPMDDSVTRTRIVTYLHAYSHNEEGDISKPVARPESVRILGAVFDLIHQVDPDHYDKMCAALQVEPELLGT